MSTKTQDRISIKNIIAVNAAVMDSGLCNGDVPGLLSIINDLGALSKANKDKRFTKYFEKHGLMLNTGDAKAAFIKEFNSNSNLDTLYEVIYNGGVISVKSLPEVGNIYELCSQFSKEARGIMRMLPYGKSTSATGYGEIFFRFILKEGTLPRGKGDVGISKNNILEVKCSDRAGAHAEGQLKVSSPSVIYKELDSLFGIKESGHIDYILEMNNRLFNDRLKRYLSSGGTLYKVATAIVNGVCKQYSQDASKMNLTTLYSQAAALLKDKEVSHRELANIINCTQLYLYQLLEGFKYFILVDAQTGDYFFIKNKSIFADYKKILRHITFTSPYMSGKRDWTGKMSLRVLHS